MSKILGTDVLRVRLANWYAQATRPDLGGGPSADLGSILTQPESGNAHLFFKTGAQGLATGWTRQNLTNLKVFKITDFGAVGDNTVNNDPFINATITAAIAAGGGIVYIPKGQFAVIRSTVKNHLASFDLVNRQNITFMGDGYQSRLRMKGDGQGADWYLFRVMDGSNRIKFHNFHVDAEQVTNPDPSHQLHFIQIEGLNTPGGHDTDVMGMFFGKTVGDCVRLFGERESTPIYDNHILFNEFDMQLAGAAATRSAIGFQRNVLRTLIAYNFMTGSTDNTIDFEPTGDVGLNEEDCIYGNQLDGMLRNAQVITYGGVGVASPAANGTIAHNIIFNGGSFGMVNASKTMIVGNVIVDQNDTTNLAVILGTRVIDGICFIGNCLVATGASLIKRVVDLESDTLGQVARCIVDGNTIVTPNAEAPIIFESGTQMTLQGNVISSVFRDPANSVFAKISSNLYPVDLVVVRHNLMVPTSGVGQASLTFAATTVNIANVLLIGNYGRNAGVTAGPLFTAGSGGPGVFTRWHGSVDSLWIGGTSNTVQQNPTLVDSMTVMGNAGMGPSLQQTQQDVGPEGILQGAIGSLATNTNGSGSADTVFWKNSGIPTSTTGWLRVGPTERTWGCGDTTNTTTALFLAPSSDLAVAGATEIQFRVWKACAIQNMRVHQTAGVGGGVITYTLRRNGVDTSSTVGINFTATTGSNLVSVSFAAGDLASLKITKSQAPATSPKNVVVTCEIT